MVLLHKHNKPFFPTLSMNQNLINNVNSRKHLEFIFSEDCSWHDHLKLVKDKVWHRINIMHRLKLQLDRKIYPNYINYTSFIRPLHEYANVVWDNCTPQEANDLEKNITKLPVLSQEQPNLHQSNLFCLTRVGKVSH